MTACEQQDGLLPELLVLVASVEDADVLAALGARDREVLPVLVATGRDPMAVDEALDDLGALAGRVLIVDDAEAGPAAEAAVLLPRIDALVADDRPGAVLVRGGSPTALVAAQVAVWRSVPLVALPVDGGTAVETANQAAIAALVATQHAAEIEHAKGVRTADVRSVAAAQRLVRERLAATDAPRVLRLPTDHTLSA
ncbi:hypothetical protein [Actinomycetospora chibensis]|uniref:Uncharacterized protein n=1 Tax=Actinomycetospora chibensis TaxID=663606 RepID=A0ABV9REV7_9PSEU|nr:hypothetical protein [Actinomycetospora chibensis]MDD7924095.1 hypothetical protein [Actinomycetospora chibensis]